MPRQELQDQDPQVGDVLLFHYAGDGEGKNGRNGAKLIHAYVEFQTGTRLAPDDREPPPEDDELPPDDYEPGDPPF